MNAGHARRRMMLMTTTANAAATGHDDGGSQQQQHAEKENENARRRKTEHETQTSTDKYESLSRRAYARDASGQSMASSFTAQQSSTSMRTRSPRTGTVTVSLTRYDDVDDKKKQKKKKKKKTETEVGRAMMKRAMAVRLYRRDAHLCGQSTRAIHLPQRMGEIDIATSDSGKPFFVMRDDDEDGQGEDQTCGVSVAHSAGVVVTALGPTQDRNCVHDNSVVDVGVDLEIEDRRMRVPVWRRFRETERVFVETGRYGKLEDGETRVSAYHTASHGLQHLPKSLGGDADGGGGGGEISPAQLRRFLLLWTIKEAIAKKRGTGIDLEKIGTIRIGFRRFSSLSGVLPVHVIDTDEEILVLRVTDARVSSGSAAAIVAVCADRQQSRDGVCPQLELEAEFVPDVMSDDTDSLACEVLATSDGWSLS